MNESSATIVVGGGITGLYSAYLLKKRRKDLRVVVVEAEPGFGGLLRSFDYGPNGLFDYGVHTFYETGLPELDDVMLGILPENEWKFLVGRDKDLGGSSQDGPMQFNTPYLDIARRADFNELIVDFFDNLGRSGTSAADNARDEAIRLYGPKIAERIVVPAIEARQHLPADQVHPLALRIQGLARIAALPLDTVLKLYDIRDFGARLAFPDQRQSPEDMVSDKRAFYPAKIGLQRFIDRFADLVSREGVELLPSTRVKSVERSNGKVDALVLTSEGLEDRRIATETVVWTAGFPALGFALGFAKDAFPLRRPNRTLIANLLVDGPVSSGGVYYGYFHGHPRANRVGFPANFSRESRPDGKIPVTLELVYDPSDDVSNAATVAEAALREAGILTGQSTISFIQVEELKGGYPSLSIGNLQSIKRMREAIDDLAIGNLLISGPLAKEDLFYQFDVMRHAHELISAS
ncbi:MAG: FAD-dependent oxidoreductase [Alphaproteobacteria bacterium]|nr:FAD-dependent oxidoreductase [Alphaproteobacteria bacterium]